MFKGLGLPIYAHSLLRPNLHFLSNILQTANTNQHAKHRRKVTGTKAGILQYLSHICTVYHPGFRVVAPPCPSFPLPQDSHTLGYPHALIRSYIRYKL